MSTDASFGQLLRLGAGSSNLTKMPLQEERLRDLERVARLRALRNWALCLGVVAFTLAAIATGIFEAGNLKNWSNLYLGLALEGLLRLSIAPLLAAGSALAIAGALLHGLVKRRHGEV